MREINHNEDNIVKALGFTADETVEILKGVEKKAQSGGLTTTSDIDSLSDDEKECLLIVGYINNPMGYIAAVDRAVGREELSKLSSFPESLKYVLSEDKEETKEYLLEIANSITSSEEGEDKDA